MYPLAKKSMMQFKAEMTAEMTAKKYPVRTYWQARVFADRLERNPNKPIRVDGCICIGVPCIGVRVTNGLGTDLLTWDSFLHLWLQNCECDEHFVTKPSLARPT